MHNQWQQSQAGAVRKTTCSLEEPGETKVEGELLHGAVGNRTVHYSSVWYEAAGRGHITGKVGDQRQRKVAPKWTLDRALLGENRSVSSLT